MKSIQEVMNTSVNEARNHPYSVSLLVNGQIIAVDITLKDPKNADLFDQFLEEEMNSLIYHVDGGPNDIEL